MLVGDARDACWKRGCLVETDATIARVLREILGAKEDCETRQNRVRRAGGVSLEARPLNG